ncbi:MAG: biopolymer transporter Tol [Ignavibacteriae bacterium]|nr:biopolymer transporter Tol [Ignavibacteriota bacterium]NOG97366.1 biopolymer transporter Tol [Ignavibacteriota bacterium]
MKKTFLVLFISFCFSAVSFAQFNDYEPEYEWFTIEMEHVFVHYHPEAERTAEVVAKIAEEVWGPITSLYGYEPDKVHYVIKDVDDYSNGATFFFDNKIEIWASALEFDLRGTHNWLRNVITHEFTHMVQIQASMKLGRTIPAIYFQLLNYEDTRRPDILYGYPNVIVSYPIATLNVPAWYAEGTAQYMRKELEYENWDTHRDMILRSYALDGNMLTWNQMGVFGKTSLGNESVYNSGFALISYINQKYGEAKLYQINERLGAITNFTIDAAFEDVIGIDGNELYDEWSAYLKEDYKKRMADVYANRIEGTKICSTGFGNFYPAFSNNDSTIYYLSNKGSDYFRSNLYSYNIADGKEKLIQPGIRSSHSKVKGKNEIIYAKLSEKNSKWKVIHDLYVYNLDEEEETRLTYGLRANNPNVSNDGKKIVFTFQYDGTTNIGLVDIDGQNFKKLTTFKNGEQVLNPKFSPNDDYVVFGYIKDNNRDIAKVNTDGSNFDLLISTYSDERNPVFGKDGNLYYSSDVSNIFNIYSYDLENKKSKQLTNVTGGAFYPTVNSKGDIAYAGYTSEGYKIFLIQNETQQKVDDSKNYVWLNHPPLNKPSLADDIADFDFEYLKNYDDNELPEFNKTDYRGKFTKLSIAPFIRIDNYNTKSTGLEKIKPGAVVYSSDYLNRYSLFASGSINSNLERDLYLQFQFRNKLPLLYGLGLTPELTLEIFNISREADVDISFGADSTNGQVIFDNITKTDVTYDLFEVDFALKHKIFAAGNDIEFRFIFSRYIAKLGSFILPETNILYPTSKDEYFIGRNLQVTLNHEAYMPDRDRDINPIGRKITLQYNYEFNKYNPDGEREIEDGVLKPIYNNYNFHRLELNWFEHIGIVEGHTVTARLRAATILGPQMPDFFDHYLGGLVGMKGYPFYAISGNELGWVNLSYRFPLFRNIDARLGHLYFDKIFISLYADYGNAWNGKFEGFDEFKKGFGAEVRLKMVSFYLFPTSLFFNASYAVDKIEREVRGEIINYGKEWRLYGGILFDFSF